MTDTVIKTQRVRLRNVALGFQNNASIKMEKNRQTVLLPVAADGLVCVPQFVELGRFVTVASVVIFHNLHPSETKRSATLASRKHFVIVSP